MSWGLLWSRASHEIAVVEAATLPPMQVAAHDTPAARQRRRKPRALPLQLLRQHLERAEDIQIVAPARLPVTRGCQPMPRLEHRQAAAGAFGRCQRRDA